MSELLSIREIIELLVKQDRPFAAENQPPIRTPQEATTTGPAAEDQENQEDQGICLTRMQEKEGMFSFKEMRWLT
jgi:hypothetical protein